MTNNKEDQAKRFQLIRFNPIGRAAIIASVKAVIAFPTNPI